VLRFHDRPRIPQRGVGGFRKDRLPLDDLAGAGRFGARHRRVFMEECATDIVRPRSGSSIGSTVRVSQLHVFSRWSFVATVSSFSSCALYQK
jgi:hypothetical protein